MGSMKSNLILIGFKKIHRQEMEKGSLEWKRVSRRDVIAERVKFGGLRKPCCVSLGLALKEIKIKWSRKIQIQDVIPRDHLSQSRLNFSFIDHIFAKM